MQINITIVLSGVARPPDFYFQFWRYNMKYSVEETQRILKHHIGKIASNWTSDDFIMGHLTSGKPVLIDFRDHKIANDFCRIGFCQATVDELQEIVDFKTEIPEIALKALNATLISKGHPITSKLVFDHFTEGHKLYIKLELSPEEADRRFKETK